MLQLLLPYYSIAVAVKGVLFRLVPYFSNAAPRTGAAADSTGTPLLHVVLLHELVPYSLSAVAWTSDAAASAGSLLLQYCYKGIFFFSAVARTGTAASASS